MNKPDDTSMFALLNAKTAVGGQYLQNQAGLLKFMSQMPPQRQVFDTGRLSQEAAELGIENKIRSRDFESLTDPSAARMRQTSRTLGMGWLFCAIVVAMHVHFSPRQLLSGTGPRHLYHFRYTSSCLSRHCCCR